MVEKVMALATPPSTFRLVDTLKRSGESKYKRVILLAMTLSELYLRPQRTSYYWLPLCLSNPEKLMGPEAKLYKKIKKATPTISWNRIENLAFPGMPDTLAYNKYNQFFTVEFKVTRGNKVRFSPHQISFHVKHPNNTFICIEHLGSGTVKLFRGSQILELEACGLELEACCLGLDACGLMLDSLGA